MQDIRLRKCLARPVWPGTLFQCNTGTAIIGAISNAGGAATITDIPEIGAYTRIYQLDIPDNAPYDTSAVPYGADNSGTPTAAGISRSPITWNRVTARAGSGSGFPWMPLPRT